MNAIDAAGRAPVFIAKQLTKIYRMGEVEVRALRDLDLEIREGEFIVLLGPSGSGKSTLLNILGGLDTPTSGEAFWRDHNLATAGEAELTRYRREHVGFVFQFYNLIPSLTVRENVALVTDIAVSPMTAEEALDRVGLSGRLDHFPSQLSGGEQQRVAIARALINDPPILLCDEPTGNLDEDTSEEIRAAIWDLNRDAQLTTVIVTHNMDLARRAHRVVHMTEGRIEAINGVAE